MSTLNRRPPSSSSSSSTKRVTIPPENSMKKVTTAAKPQLAKKRPALVEVTNQRNGSRSSNSRTSVPSFKPLVPCAAKIGKTKKEFSACTETAGYPGNTLPAPLSVKSRVLVPSKASVGRQASFPGNDQPMATQSSVSTVLPAPSSILHAPRRMDVSPSRSVSSSISMDESMSTCDSLKSPEFEYIDNEDVSAVKSIERKTSNSLYISDNSEKIAGNVRKRDILVGMETFDKVVDIDNNFMDPQLCATIACDIYKHLRACEANKRPSIDFMERIQKDINASMRAILIDWLVEVAEEYRLLPDTLFLTVNYIDRYLSGNSMNRQRLQLLGIGCMMIAAKYEEICSPNVEEFCYITDNTYLKEEVLQMESAVLNYLKFEMTAPTAKCFLRRFVFAAEGTSEVPSMLLECLANYLTELSLLEYSMLRYAPSLIAASATFLARFILFPLKKPWNSTLRHYTLYQASDLYDCVKALHSLCCNGSNSNLPAIREKYSQHKYKFVAKKYCPPAIPSEFFQDLSN